MAAGRAPVPFCVAKPEVKEIPLSLGEQLIHPLDNFFSGYNLDLTIATNSSNFARLNRKL